MTLTRRTKLLLYAAGTVLLLLSLYYVGSRVAENWSAVRSTRIDNPLWLFACFAFYASSHVSTGLSWPLAVRQLETDFSILDGLKIGLVAQIGKYLPGNLMHYAGRGALATQFGVSLRSSGISTAIELASALSAVLIVGAIGLAADPRPIAALPAISASGFAIFSVAIAGLVATWFWLRRRGARLALVLAPSLCLGVSFTLSGLSLYALAQGIGNADLPLAIAIGAFAVAWGTGFVVIGAPAGIGVREAVLLTLLSPFVGTGAAIAITLLHRVMTAIVDVAAAFVGYAWLAIRSRSKK